MLASPRVCALALAAAGVAVLVWLYALALLRHHAQVKPGVRPRHL